MHIHKQVTIACPPAKLWRCLTEPAIQKQWLVDVIDDIPDDPAKRGAGAFSTMRIREGGKVQVYRSLVTAWEPERKLAIQLTGGSFAAGMAMDVTYAIASDDAGSVLDYDVIVPLQGFAFKLMAPLIWVVSQSNARKALDKLAEVSRK